MKEIEAKFVAADPSVFDQILAHEKLGGYELKFRERQLLVTDYFDTECWDLLRSRSVLRLRRAGRDCKIGLKTLVKRSGAIQTREEIEEDLADGYPQKIDCLESPVMDRVRRITAPHPLLLVLTVENNRTIVEMLRGGECRFEMVLDDVEFVGARDQRRHFEVEIESKGGDQYELESLLGILGSGFPLEPSVESKFERGLRLTRIWPVGVQW